MKQKKTKRKKIFTPLVVGILAGLGILTITYSQEAKKDDCFFNSSLHATSKGMEYWYDKANGGLETITGIPYSELGCKNCHISSCDVCHKNEVNGKPVYSGETAKKQEKCLTCHAREAHMIKKIDEPANTPDVHFASGMGCMDCHTVREMHGDGIEYKSMKDPGVMDVTCEQCHEAVSKTISHIIHGKKLDCKACHVRHVVSCTNCHFETMVKENKRVAQPITGWKFLMNYKGKVTSANMQTFVVPENKTFLIFAPQFSHSVKKEGDKCEECHATNNVKQVIKDKIDLTWLEKEKVEQIKGVIPVADGCQYYSVYQNFEKGTWTPISPTTALKVQYVGYGSPLTKEQLNKLARKQKNKK